MNVFEEFNRIVLELEKQKVRYALVGGVAMAFYSEPRFTRDIDILVDIDDFDTAKGLLEDDMMIDILIAKDEEVRRIIQNAVEAESKEGRVMLADKKDLIWLKRLRDSKQDQADIERLEDDKNR